MDTNTARGRRGRIQGTAQLGEGSSQGGHGQIGARLVISALRLMVVADHPAVMIIMEVSHVTIINKLDSQNTIRAMSNKEIVMAMVNTRAAIGKLVSLCRCIKLTLLQNLEHTETRESEYSDLDHQCSQWSRSASHDCQW